MTPKVTRTALENAASVAGTVLLTECVVVDNPEDKKESDPMAKSGVTYKLKGNIKYNSAYISGTYTLPLTIS